MWNLIFFNKKIPITDLQNRNRPTDIENKFMVTKGETWGRDKSGDWDEHTHTTIYKIDNQQGLLYSTENSTQYSVITYMRKESKK